MSSVSRAEIKVDHIARVEGHGDIHLVVEDGQVQTCELRVTEAARLFESMVKGRPYHEVPYIASRVCGICSASHTVTDILAIERIFGVEVTERTRALRELLIYGSFLQNHAFWQRILSAAPLWREALAAPSALSPCRP